MVNKFYFQSRPIFSVRRVTPPFLVPALVHVLLCMRPILLVLLSPKIQFILFLWSFHYSVYWYQEYER